MEYVVGLNLTPDHENKLLHLRINEGQVIMSIIILYKCLQILLTSKESILILIPFIITYLCEVFLNTNNAEKRRKKTIKSYSRHAPASQTSRHTRHHSKCTCILLYFFSALLKFKLYFYVHIS